MPLDVEKLMDETIRLVQLIYWKPEKNAPYRKLMALSFPTMDVDVQDTADVEMGMRPMRKMVILLEGLVSVRRRSDPSSVMVKMRHWSNG